MARPQILIDFSPRRYSDLELQMKAIWIVKRMTDNPYFPDPVPSLLVVKQATEKYAKSLTKSIDGTKADTLVKKSDRRQLQYLLRKLALYVKRVSNENAAIILNSGFGIQKIPAKIGPIPQPTRFSVRYDSQSGCVILQCDVIKKVDCYEFQYTMEPVSKDSIWNHIISTKHRAKIVGLAKDRYYAFRVAGIATDPTRNYTDCISKMVV